jgi:glutamine synthetase
MNPDAADVLARVERDGIETIRLSFPDPHGLLRGKTMDAGALAGAFRDGVATVTTLLSKDSSGRTVFPTFSPGGGVGMAEMAGAGDMLMIPDPSTFRVLDWAGRTGWMLCDLVFTSGAPVPFCSRTALRRAVAAAATRGFDVLTGLEVEFHVFRLADPDHVVPGQPPDPPAVLPLTGGYQLLSEDAGDRWEPVLALFRGHLAGLGITLRSAEVEFGPSQLEVTLPPLVGMAAADTMVLLRSALRQVGRRHGYHVTFMCRPQLPATCSSGWHLHQSLRGPDGNAFVPDDQAALLSKIGRQFVAGQLAHARAGCAFAAPTINGYKRFLGAPMAPDRVVWARDDRSAMVRVVGSAETGTTHIENRIGEPAANPYLYLTSQLHAGLDGIDHALDPGPPADIPLATDAPRLPGSLSEALTALEADTVLARAMGEALTAHHIALKRAEIARFEATVTDWEHREYFGLF